MIHAHKLHAAADEIEALRASLRDMVERTLVRQKIAAFLVREADSITKYPFELHENAQRFRRMAAELSVIDTNPKGQKND